MIDVLCIGTAAFDINLPLEDFPEENRKYEIRRSFETGGGPAANAASLLSKWGVSAALACVIGDDLFGRRILDELNAEGAELSLIGVRSGYGTPLSCILVNQKTGSRTIINRHEGAPPLVLEESTLRGLNPRVILMDGHQLDASLKAIAVSPQAKTILDAGSRRKGTEVLSRKVDYLIGSEGFALDMTGVSRLQTPVEQEQCLKGLFALNGKNVAITLGEKGTIYLEGGRLASLPALAVQAVDTTAAGDVFHGAFAYAVLHGKTFAEALWFSSTTAGLSVARPGGRSSFPNLREVEKALQDA